jgi:hypothetical protein
LVAANAHHRQYIRDPLAAQTISSASTVQAQFQTLETDALDNLFLTLKVYTVDSGGTFKSALLAVVGKGTEPTTALRNTSFAATALNGSGGNVTVAAGDYLVVEIGLGGTPTATSGVQGHNGTIRWGCNASSGDLPVDETQAATTYRPWVEFSANLLFLKTAIPSADNAQQYADSIGGGKYALLRWVDSASATAGQPNITVNPAADALGSYADAGAKALRTLPGWNDQLTTFRSGLLPIAVNLPSDGLAAYADSATILFTGALAVSISDSMGLYADAPPTIAEAVNAAPSTDSLGLYADQPPTISFSAIISVVDALSFYTDTATILQGFLTTPAADSLAGYADAITLGSSGQLFITSADSLGLYSDQAPTMRQNIFTVLAESLIYGDSINGFVIITTRPPSDDFNQWADGLAVSIGQNIGLTADSFNVWADTFTKLHGALAGLNDSMAQTDQLAGAAAKSMQLSDALPGYADQILITQGGQKVAQLSDGIPNWSDQIAISGGVRLGWADSMTASGGIQRQGWVDSLIVTSQAAGARTVNLSDARPAFTDTIAERYGYQQGFVIYLVDENGNYIIDENGNRFLVSGLIDNLQQGDAVAMTLTTAGTTPRVVSISDTLAGYSDQIQVSRGVVSLQISLSDDLINYTESLQPIAGFVFSISDDVGGYNDSSPALSTSGELRVSQSDTVPIYTDAIQVNRFSFIDLAFSLADDLGGYNDAILINTSGGLLTSSGDTLAGYNDTTAIERTGALTAALTDTLAFADQATINLGILRAASDNLAAYSDTPAQLRGLLYSTPADGLTNYLDLITAGGTGQIQAALSDNLGQYNDAPPATFANFKAQPAADALIYADSAQRVVATSYALSDSALALDDLLDLRLGLFNELRYGLSDNMNQWADAAAYSRVFLAIKISGKVTEQINLSGKLITDKISLTGEFYTGDP